MKTLLLAWVASIGLSAAQDSGTIDLDARRDSVVTLKQLIEMRQKRLDGVVAEIRGRGQQTDEQIESLVKTLANVKDSQDSKRRISQVKADAVGGLKRLIAVYHSERAKITEQLRTEGLSPDLTDDLAVFDKLVQKRADDIVELVKSMPGGADVDKYERESEYSRNDITYENSRISEAWRQNRRDKVETEKLRRETQQALEKAIADLERRRDGIAATLASGTASSAEKEIQNQELARVTDLLGQRKSQRAEVMLPSAPPAEATSKGEADDLEDLFNDARGDIAAGISKNLQLYRKAVVERGKIESLKENLAAREKWLSENDPAAKKSE